MARPLGRGAELYRVVELRRAAVSEGLANRFESVAAREAGGTQSPVSEPAAGLRAPPASGTGRSVLASPGWAARRTGARRPVVWARWRRPRRRIDRFDRSTGAPPKQTGRSQAVR